MSAEPKIKISWQPCLLKCKLNLYDNGDFSVRVKNMTEKNFYDDIVCVLEDKILTDAKFIRTLTMTKSMSLDEAFQEVYYHIESVPDKFGPKYNRVRMLGYYFSEACHQLYLALVNAKIPERILKKISCFRFALLKKVSVDDLYKYMPLSRLEELWAYRIISQRHMKELRNYRKFNEKVITKEITKLQKHLLLWEDFSVDENCMKCDRVLFGTDELATVFNTPRIACINCMGRLHKTCQKQMDKEHQPRKCLICGNDLIQVY